jgi:hypothetical protein
VKTHTDAVNSIRLKLASKPLSTSVKDLACSELDLITVLLEQINEPPEDFEEALGMLDLLVDSL